MIPITRIEQLHAEGKQAQREGLPFSACPYPGHTEHEARWQWGFMAAMLETKEAA